MKAYKFSIRELVCLITLIATLLGWWLDRRMLAERNERLSREIKVWKSNVKEVGRFLEPDWYVTVEEDGGVLIQTKEQFESSK